MLLLTELKYNPVVILKKLVHLYTSVDKKLVNRVPIMSARTCCLQPPALPAIAWRLTARVCRARAAPTSANRSLSDSARRVQTIRRQRPRPAPALTTVTSVSVTSPRNATFYVCAR